MIASPRNEDAAPESLPISSVVGQVPLYLDANVFDSILDDPERDRLVNALQARYRVLVGAANLAELVPRDESRRGQLEKLALDLMTDDCLLDDPRAILNRVLQQDRLGAKVLDVLIPYDAASIASMLAHPDYPAVAARQRQQNIELRSESTAIVKSLREMRFVLDPKAWAQIRQLTCEQFMAEVLRDDDRIYDLCAGMLRAAGATPYQVRQAASIIRRYTPWRTFLAAEIATIYFNGIRPLRRKLGLSDMFQTVNLAWVGVFVTNDNSFRVLAEEVARAVLPQDSRRVLSYPQFRAELLLENMPGRPQSAV